MRNVTINILLEDYFRSKDALVHLTCAVENDKQKNARITGYNDHFRCASFGFFALSLLSVPHNKQLNNLDRSVVTGKSQTSASRIDLAIARSIRQGLSLRFPCNDLTLGY